MEIKKECIFEVRNLELVNSIWADRRNSNLIKWLMLQSGISIESMAEFLGKKTSVFNNKLNRGVFSFHELLIAAYACDFSFLLTDSNKDVIRRIDPKNELGAESLEWQRISALKNKMTIEQKKALFEEKKREYHQLEQELELLKEEIEEGV